MINIKSKFFTNIIIFLLLLCSSCARKEVREAFDESLGVNLDFSSNVTSKSTPLIEKTNNPQEFPLPFTNPSIKENLTPSKRLPVVALFLGTGFDKSLAYLSLLKSLEEKGINVHLLSGIEFGGIIATLYAQGLTIDAIEWRFHKFLKKVSDKNFNLEKSLNLIEEILLGGDDHHLIQNAKTKLLLPGKSNGSCCSLITRGPIISTIKDTFINFDKIKLKKKDFLKEGADILIFAQIDDEKISSEKKYKTSIENFNEENFSYDYKVTISTSGKDFQELSYLKLSKNLKDDIEKIQELIKLWN